MSQLKLAGSKRGRISWKFSLYMVDQGPVKFTGKALLTGKAPPILLVRKAFYWEAPLWGSLWAGGPLTGKAPCGNRVGISACVL